MWSKRLKFQSSLASIYILHTPYRYTGMSHLTALGYEYILCGYDLCTPEQGRTKCLLYDEVKGTFDLVALCLEERRGCLRDAFRIDYMPPFVFTRVVDNVFTGQIQPSENTTPVFTVDTLPHTTLRESDIDSIFGNVPITIKRGVANNAARHMEMTESEYVNTTGFTQGFLNAVRVGLMKKLGLKAITANCIIPTRLDTLFVGFEPVDYYASSDRYPHGPDSVILRHKIIKNVLESACPYIRVAMFNSMGMEKALALCLPTGSRGKGMEIFRPRKQNPEACLKISDDLIYDGGSFEILTPAEAAQKTTVFEVPSPPNTGCYFEWIPINHKGVDDKKPSIDYRVFETQLEILKSAYVWSDKADYFRKGTVVYSIHDAKDQFACMDFSNFYANVAMLFGLDDYISEVLRRMTKFRKKFPAMKNWIVAILGKARWQDPFFYNRMKALSVAVMLSTIRANSHIVTGSATDGLFVKPDALDIFVYPRGFSVKKEFIPLQGSPMVSKGPSHYAGICRRTGKIVHRGCIGQGKNPEWYHDVISVLLKGCLGLLNDVTTMTTITMLLNEKASITRQFILPDTHSMPLPVVDKRSCTEYFVNELCTGICQMYAVVDDHVVPASAMRDHDPPSTQNAWVIKWIDVEKYIQEIGDKISRVAALFPEQQCAISLCENVARKVIEHIKQTLPKDRAMFPGGVDCV